jgi:hypothetical protein
MGMLDERTGKKAPAVEKIGLAVGAAAALVTAAPLDGEFGADARQDVRPAISGLVAKGVLSKTTEPEPFKGPDQVAQVFLNQPVTTIAMTGGRTPSDSGPNYIVGPEHNTPQATISIGGRSFNAFSSAPTETETA